MIHIDIKKLGRFEQVGHRITGDRQAGRSRAVGWEFVHVSIDSRVGFSQIPLYAVNYVVSHLAIGGIVIGAVFLAVTGTEALYADLGHFGRRPLVVAWFGLVFPCLVLNYIGQGAYVLANPAGAANPFFEMHPDWARVPMVFLATAATVIASQAVITGGYSLVRQAVALNLLPRMSVKHTSETQSGQIYMPQVNTMLLVGVILLVLGFGSSSWRWSLVPITLVMVPFLLIDIGSSSRMPGSSCKVAGYRRSSVR